MFCGVAVFFCGDCTARWRLGVVRGDEPVVPAHPPQTFECPRVESPRAVGSVERVVWEGKGESGGGYTRFAALTLNG